MLAGEDLGWKKKIRSVSHWLIWKEQFVPALLHEWHCCQWHEGHTTPNDLPVEMGWLETACLPWVLQTSYTSQLDSSFLHVMLVISGARVSIRFRRRCSNGEGSRINGIWAIKVESQKTSLHKRQRECWKETFLSRIGVYICFTRLDLVSQERLLPKEIVLVILRRSSNSAFSLHLETQDLISCDLAWLPQLVVCRAGTILQADLPVNIRFHDDISISTHCCLTGG